MKFQELFSITIVHAYFAQGPADVVILPDLETEKRLAKRNILPKNMANGVKCLIGVDENTIQMQAKKIENEVFVFYVFPTSSTVREFTDTSSVTDGKMMFFTNEDMDSDQVELTLSEIAQEGNRNGFPALAKIEVRAKELGQATSEQATKYQVSFSTIALKWKYYFLADRDENDLSIQAVDASIVFNELERKEDFTDQITTSLELNFPDREVLVFESDVSIPLRNIPIKDINLKRDGEVLIKHLPNPDIRNRGVQIIKIK